jgi:hypothetical protein
MQVAPARHDRPGSLLDIRSHVPRSFYFLGSIRLYFESSDFCTRDVACV